MRLSEVFHGSTQCGRQRKSEEYGSAGAIQHTWRAVYAFIGITHIRLSVLHGQNISGTDIDASTAPCAFSAVETFHGLLLQGFQRRQPIAECQFVAVKSIVVQIFIPYGRDGFGVAREIQGKTFTLYLSIRENTNPGDVF